MRIGISGFGRIGRMVLRSALQRGVDLDIVAINDRGDAAINAHLFQFDSTYGPYHAHVEARDGRSLSATAPSASSRTSTRARFPGATWALIW